MSHFKQLPVPAAALVHLTHWKAGSQWFRAVTEDAFGEAVQQPEPGTRHFFGQPLALSKIYPCGYLTVTEFKLLSVPAEHRRVLIIRDLRDTLVSGYYSIRYSHTLVGNLEKYRWVLNQCSEEDGLLYLMEAWLPQSALVQRTWLEAQEPFMRFEEFMVSPERALMRAFNEFWRISISEDAVEHLVAKHSFANHSGGRKPGEEDRLSHYRKGVAGEWREHFTPKVMDAFDRKFGHLVRLAGYDQSATVVGA